jgi:chemotaxis protein MotB
MKKKPEEHVNHERWLVSWADFMTLLFALFVVLFAASQVDDAKVGKLSSSFTAALGESIFTGGGGVVFQEDGRAPGKSASGGNNPKKEEGGGAQDRMGDDGKGPSEQIDLMELKLKMENALRDQHTKIPIEVLERRNEIVLRVSSSLLFASGEDRLNSGAEEAIAEVASQIRDLDVEVRVEGHSDDAQVPEGSRWRSNWELSGSRAMAVVDELIGPGAIVPQRLSGAGYGEYRPIADNATENGRQKNRRVEIVIIPFKVTSKG